MKKLKDLLKIDLDIEVLGITDDSRKVKEGFLFVATKGFHVDHFDYIQDAIERGCSFIVADRAIPNDFPHLVVSNIDDVYKELCMKFYDISLEQFHFIGITGTDGKTTTATIVKDLIGDCAYIGTNGVMIGKEVFSTDNTTPCVAELYKDLQIIQEHGVFNVVMEVSSEALLHNRVNNFTFDIIAFTNITGDHLNVHGSFDNYVQAKMKLLNLVKKDGFVVVNGDDDTLQKINCPNLYKIGFNDDNDCKIENVKNLSFKTTFDIVESDFRYPIVSPFKGIYNVYNVTMAFVVTQLFGYEGEKLRPMIPLLEPISGRGEILDFGQDYTIVLDYAHTINGIRNVLDAYQDYDEIITVTGAAGGREKEKRPIIGDMVIEKSTIPIFTMDDPRYESVHSIIDEMVGKKKDYVRIINREEAIFYALSIAHPGSVVLILGKGRDNYMAIEDKKIPYNDYDVISKYFND